MNNLKNKFFNAFMILTTAANAAAFLVGLDWELDFLSWEMHDAFNMISGTALTLTTWVCLAYPVALLVRAIRNKIIERRVDRHNLKQVMSMM